MTQTANKIEIRDIIEINEDLCNGCGQCLAGCAEGALALVNGKAKLVSDIYCDGLGACLGHCPTGALKVIKRQAPDFNEEAAMARVRQLEAAAKNPAKQACGCPGSRAMKLADNPDEAEAPANGPRPQLAFWPIQLKLAPPSAPAFDSPVLVLAADCTGFTGPDFHRTFLTEKHPLVMACPKLDDLEPNIEKLAAIFKAHPAISELRVPMMSVPCCGGLGYMAAEAIKRAGRDGEIKVRTWIITPEGRVTEELIR